MSAVARTPVSQFGRPRGALGHVVGWIMSRRSSNRERTRVALDRLGIESGDRVLELGFGPGLGIARAAELASSGHVVGLDHSDLMVAQATRRNRAAIDAGRVALLLGSAENLAALELGGRFDKVLAVNVAMFWREPLAVLAGLRRVLKPGARVALVQQPRQRGAREDDARAAAEHWAEQLKAAGFVDLRLELLPMQPVSAGLVLAHEPGGRAG